MQIKHMVLDFQGDSPRPFFWRTQGGAEVDLILESGTRLVAVEVKLSGNPSISRGFHECLKDLGCPGFVIHGGKNAFPIGPSVRALPAAIVSEPERVRKALFG